MLAVAASLSTMAVFPVAEAEGQEVHESHQTVSLRSHSKVRHKNALRSIRLKIIM
jgi:hypothetical protein